MKTTIDIPEDILKSTMEFTKASTKKEAILTAMKEFNRQQIIKRLIASAGTWDIATNDEIEKGETDAIAAMNSRAKK